MEKNVVLILGDGTGPEICESAVRCIDAAVQSEGNKINWITRFKDEDILAGETAIQRYNTPLPEHVLDAVKEYKVALKGPVITPIGTGFRSVNVALRQSLDLYACLRPCKIYSGVKTRYSNVDLVVVRENTEDLYAGIEFEKGNTKTRNLIEIIEESSGKNIKRDSGISIKPISESATKRIVNFAFEYARNNNRKKVTAVTKANIMKHSDGLFMKVAQEVAKNYPDIEYEHGLIDNMCMQLVQKPELYDVLVLPNLYGDIVSDLCAGLVGGLGVAPSANIGDNTAVFEAVHGAAPKYTGQNKVNPSAVILSGVLMLKYFGWDNSAKKLEDAVSSIIKEGKYVTYDLKQDRNDPTAVGTKEMADAVIYKIKKKE